MELLFVALGGVLLGLVAHYALPGRDTTGVLLLPAIGAAVSAVIWVGLTWAGLAWDAGVIWAITLLATALVCGAASLLLARMRVRGDELRLVELSRPRGARPGQ